MRPGSQESLSFKVLFDGQMPHPALTIPFESQCRAATCRHGYGTSLQVSGQIRGPVVWDSRRVYHARRYGGSSVLAQLSSPHHANPDHGPDHAHPAK